MTEPEDQDISERDITYNSELTNGTNDTGQYTDAYWILIKAIPTTM